MTSSSEKKSATKKQVYAAHTPIVHTHAALENSSALLETMMVSIRHEQKRVRAGDFSGYQTTMTSVLSNNKSVASFLRHVTAELPRAPLADAFTASTKIEQLIRHEPLDFLHKVVEPLIAIFSFLFPAQKSHEKKEHKIMILSQVYQQAEIIMHAIERVKKEISNNNK